MTGTWVWICYRYFLVGLVSRDLCFVVCRTCCVIAIICFLEVGRQEIMSLIVFTKIERSAQKRSLRTRNIKITEQNPYPFFNVVNQIFV